MRAGRLRRVVLGRHIHEIGVPRAGEDAGGQRGRADPTALGHIRHGLRVRAEHVERVVLIGSRRIASPAPPASAPGRRRRRGGRCRVGGGPLGGGRRRRRRPVGLSPGGFRHEKQRGQKPMDRGFHRSRWFCAVTAIRQGAAKSAVPSVRSASKFLENPIPTDSCCLTPDSWQQPSIRGHRFDCNRAWWLK